MGDSGHICLTNDPEKLTSSSDVKNLKTTTITAKNKQVIGLKQNLTETHDPAIPVQNFYQLKYEAN